jgi:RimJ/RimL family protein N-acetyltransferase
VSPDDRAAVEPIVHELRLEVAEIIEALVEQGPARRALAQRLRDAANRCALRPWRSGDARLLAELLDDERVWTTLPEPYPGPISRAVAADMITIANAVPKHHRVCAVHWRGQPIGQVRLEFDSSPHRDSAEISYWLGEPFWGRGLATDAVVLMTADGFAANPRVRRIFARVLHGHDASVRVLSKAGYHTEESCSACVVKDGQRVGMQLLSVWRSQYVTTHGDRPAPRPSSVSLPMGMLTIGMGEFCEVVGSLAAFV